LIATEFELGKGRAQEIAQRIGSLGQSTQFILPLQRKGSIEFAMAELDNKIGERLDGHQQLAIHQPEAEQPHQQ